MSVIIKVGGDAVAFISGLPERVREVVQDKIEYYHERYIGERVTTKEKV
jgi:hypothetical protein